MSRTAPTVIRGVSTSAALLACVWWGINDWLVGADIALTLVCIAAVWWPADRAEQRRSRLATLLAHQGVERPERLLVGLVLLGAVILRQWLQVGFPELVEITALEHSDLRIRYATVTNFAYCVGWAMLLWSAFPRIDMRQLYRAHRTDIVTLMALIGIAATMRLVFLNDYPNIINGDEGLVGWWARGMFRAPGPLGYTLSAMDGVGTLYLSVLHTLIWAFGSEVWVLRVLPALAGTVSLVSIYLLGRTLYSSRIGMYAAIVLAFMHTHIHFSRQLAVSYIYAAAFLPIVLWGVWQFVQTRKAWPALVAAAALSFHANFYVDAWAWAVLTVLILVGWWIVQREQLQAALPQVGIYGVAALVGLGPQLVWGAYTPSGFFSRLEVDGSFVSGWIFTEAAAMQMSVVSYVLFLYDMALQAIYWTPFIDFYHADVPILDPLSVGLALIGAILVHNRLHTPRGLVVLGWFWGGVTALAVFTLPISTYHYRLFVIVPVLALFIALGIDAVYRVLERYSRIGAQLLVVAIVVVLAYVNIDIYINRLALDCRYGGDPMTQRAGAAARFLKEKHIRGATVVTVGQLNDMHAGTWKSFEYLNETLTFVNLFPNEKPSMYAQRGEDVYFLYIPERFLERETIEAGYTPVGDYETITMCGVLFGYLTHAKAP